MMDHNTVDFFDRQDWITKNHKEYISKVIKFSSSIY